jgi:hypothetical protein
VYDAVLDAKANVWQSGRGAFAVGLAGALVHAAEVSPTAIWGAALPVYGSWDLHDVLTVYAVSRLAWTWRGGLAPVAWGGGLGLKIGGAWGIYLEWAGYAALRVGSPGGAQEVGAALYLDLPGQRRPRCDGHGQEPGRCSGP